MPNTDLPFVCYSYAVLAILTGRMTQLAELATSRGRGLFVEPKVEWAETKLDARKASKRTETTDAKGYKFVVKAAGGLEGRIHNALISAGCRFDHWRNQPTSIMTSRGAKVVISPTVKVVRYKRKT
jgi:hypothetical protein